MFAPVQQRTNYCGAANVRWRAGFRLAIGGKAGVMRIPIRGNTDRDSNVSQKPPTVGVTHLICFSEWSMVCAGGGDAG